MGSMDVSAELTRLIADGALTEQSLEAMTQIAPAKLHTVLAGNQSGSSTPIGDVQRLTNEETTRISILSGMLSEGVSLGDDERLRSIIESLTAEVHLTVDNIAKLIDVDAQDVANVLRDPAGVPAEVKYAIGIRSSYLINSINLARGR